MINELAKKVHENAVEKGFYEKPKNTGEMLCLIHSEVSEALEADRNDKYVSDGDINFINNFSMDEMFLTDYRTCVKGTFEEEMADIMIRVMDLCAYKNIDLEAHIMAKMRYNSTREKYHGKKY